MTESAKPKFKPGNIVLLHSGGPVMTVAKVEDDLITCVWFPRHGNDDKPQEHTFEGILLRRA